MKIRITPTLLLLLGLGHLLNAQQFTYYQWNDFAGMLGGKKIYLSLYPDDNEVMAGNYFFGGKEIRTQLQGTWAGDTAHLKALQNGVPIGWFRIQLQKGNKEIKGTFRTYKGDTTLAFQAVSKGICAGDFANRYSYLYGTDAELETFLQKIKTSLETSDKTWLSSVIQFPIQVMLEPGKPFLIRNRTQFVEMYNQVFDKAFKDKLLGFPFLNLPANPQGVLLGEGMIWVFNTKKSTEEKYDYCITQINK